MNEPTSQVERHERIKQQIRTLKAQGYSYRAVGQMVLNDGKPIGTALATYYAARRPNECRGCCRPLAKVK